MFDSTRNRLRVAAGGILLLAGAAAAEPKPLVIFGDSLSDTGNKLAVRGILNSPPYDGLNAFGVPADPYDERGENFSNGDVWIEMAAEALDQGRSALPVLGRHRHADVAGNYAWGGAHAADPLVADGNRHLSEQVEAYLTDVGYVVPPETLITLFIGGNDVVEALIVLASNPPASYPDAVARLEAALGSIQANLTRLTEAGARRFLLLNVPDVSLVPAIGEGGRLITSCFAEAMNEAGVPEVPCPYVPLSTSLEEIAAGLVDQGFEVTLVDTFSLLHAVVATPEPFGFTGDPGEACVQPPLRCERANDYLFWDGLHPTEALHRILAGVVVSELVP